nr:tetratricopeptide repeat protein [uncultured Porphyromonas sp.]
MKKLLCAVALGLMTTAGAFAQIANVKAAEKIAGSGDKADFNEARRLIKEALANDETKNDPYTWYVAGLIDRENFNVEQKKSILDASADKTPMYVALANVIPTWLQVYTLETADGKGKLKYSKKVKEALLVDYQQLLNAGSYYFDQKKYAEAADVFDKFLDVKRSPLFADEKAVSEIDSQAMNIAYYAIASAYTANEYAKAIEMNKKFGDIALNKKELLQMVAASYLANKDSVGVFPILVEGDKIAPEIPFFLANIVTIYQNQGKEDEAIKYLESKLAANPSDAMALLMTGTLHERTDLKKALEWYYKAAKANPEDFNANLYLGQALYNSAAKLYENSNITAEQSAVADKLLKAAIPAREIAYKSNPDNVKGLLGSIYYQQKMDDKKTAIDNGTLEVGTPALGDLTDLIASIDFTVAPKVEASAPAQPVKKAPAKGKAKGRK